jgi:thioredoxin-like negative regulator of GroEL
VVAYRRGAAGQAADLGRAALASARVAALRTNLADLLHADGQRDAAMTHLKEAARCFA